MTRGGVGPAVLLAVLLAAFNAGGPVSASGAAVAEGWAWSLVDGVSVLTVDGVAVVVVRAADVLVRASDEAFLNPYASEGARASRHDAFYVIVGGIVEELSREGRVTIRPASIHSVVSAYKELREALAGLEGVAASPEGDWALVKPLREVKGVVVVVDPGADVEAVVARAVEVLKRHGVGLLVVWERLSALPESLQDAAVEEVLAAFLQAVRDAYSGEEPQAPRLVAEAARLAVLIEKAVWKVGTAIPADFINFNPRFLSPEAYMRITASCAGPLFTLDAYYSENLGAVVVIARINATQAEAAGMASELAAWLEGRLGTPVPVVVVVTGALPLPAKGSSFGVVCFPDVVAVHVPGASGGLSPSQPLILYDDSAHPRAVRVAQQANSPGAPASPGGQAGADKPAQSEDAQAQTGGGGVAALAAAGGAVAAFAAALALAVRRR